MAKSAAAISLIPLAMLATQIAFLLDDPAYAWLHIVSGFICAAAFGWCAAMAVK